MGQGIVNAYEKANADISRANLGNEYVSLEPGRGKGKEQVYDSTVQAFSYEPSSKMAVRDRHSVTENFDEYLQNRREQAKKDGVDEASKEREDRENAKEIARNLSQDEIERLKMMGIDVENASLSDILGMVNTLRGKEHRENLKEMLASISASSGNIDDLVVVGGKVQAGTLDVSVDLDVMDVVVENSEDAENFTLEKEDALYLLKNNLPLTKENIVKAHFSGIREMKSHMSEAEISALLPQADKAIVQAGYAINEASYEGVSMMLRHNVAIVPENVKTWMEYQEYVGQELSDVTLPDNALQASEKAADNLYENVMRITPDTVYEMASVGVEITIQSAISYERLHGAKLLSNVLKDDSNAYAVGKMRQMEEIRLSMTFAAARSLVNRDINIDTKELSKVVDMLREMENQVKAYQFDMAGVEASEANMNRFDEIGNAITNLATSPAKVLGAPLLGSEFSVRGLLMHAEQSDSETSVSVTQFEMVRRSYEAVGTAPRADMGDRISKAFGNIEDMLKEMSLPANEDNTRAVRILGYNQIEVTVENIEQVVSYDRQVNQLIDGFRPEVALALIKDNINPMDMPINELNQLIDKLQIPARDASVDNYATFLHDMERHGVVDKKERESYIGLYRAMDKLAKSGDREAGYLFANGGELTLRNLIAAMRSRKAAGIDVSVDDNFGMLEDMTFEGTRIDSQIESAFTLDVRSLKSRLDAWDEKVDAFMVENAINPTLSNASAVGEMLNNAGGIYNFFAKGMLQLKDEAIDDETEHMTDSLSGEEIMLPIEPESVLEKLVSSDSMVELYEDVYARIADALYDAGKNGMIGKDALSMAKTMQAGCQILKNMARESKYQIPVETSQGIQVMNLAVAHGENNRGNISMQMAHETYGNLEANIFVSAHGELEGYIVSDQSEGNYGLMEARAAIENHFTSIDITSIQISVGTKQVERNVSMSETADSNRLYKVAVALVQAIGSLA